MNIVWRNATDADLPLLAEWNCQLIQDEGHRNTMTIAELKERMAGWIRTDYRAVIFSENEPLAYALFKQTDSSIYLRQLFVSRDHRRRGIGKAAIAFLRGEIWSKSVRLTVDVLTSNYAAVSFWRSVGYQDYCLTLEIPPSSPLA
jgi:GNAT superfamily N-acetyltransferase